MTLQLFETARCELPCYALRLNASHGPVNRIKRFKTKRNRFLLRFGPRRRVRLRKETEKLRLKYESLIIEGNLIFESLRLAELLWRKSVLHGECVFDIRHEREFTDYYGQWVHPRMGH